MPRTLSLAVLIAPVLALAATTGCASQACSTAGCAPVTTAPCAPGAGAAAPCATPAPAKCWPHGELYAGVVPSVFPGIGGSVEVGQVFDTTGAGTWSFEMSGGKHQIDDLFGGEGTNESYAQGRAGIKLASNPNGRGHVVGRLGFAVFKATGTNDFIDVATTYYGGFVGAGYEWDLSDHWATGPEASVLFGYAEGHGGNRSQVVPQIGWHFIYSL